MIDPAKLRPTPGGMLVAFSAAVTDVVLLEVAGEYQTVSKQKMTAVRPEELEKRYTGDEKVLSTTKYDGEGVFVYFEAGREPYEIICFNAPSGRTRVHFPALAAIGEHLKSLKIKKALFRAELYLAGKKDGERFSSGDVGSVTFKGTSKEQAALQLAMIDIVMVDGSDYRNNYTEYLKTWEPLGEYFGEDETKPFHRVAGGPIRASQVAAEFARVTASGLEGLVVRRLNADGSVKVKPHLTIDAVIIGYGEGEFERDYGVTSLLMALTYPSSVDGKTFYQVFARPGTGLTDEQRVNLLDKFSQSKIEAPLAMTDSDGRTITFVKPQIIAEIEGDDLMVSGESDRPNKTQLLSWDGKAWEFHRMVNCPRLLFGVFGKLREDKDIESGGARLNQVIPDADKPPLGTGEIGQRPEVLRREVYIKGDNMLRKLILAQKHDDESFPYVISWTDYSNKRKDPLKVSVSYANTLERANALADKFLEKGVTRGFEKQEA